MAWYDEAIFYHIYPLGLSGAPKQNAYETPVHRMKEITKWVEHIKEIGCNAIYIGPLFESVGHGYETTDYKKLDSRLGDNEDLKDFVKHCHNDGIKVIFDGVFNHTGRDFFAFTDIKKNRESSQYLNWYCNVNFGGNNEYNDGFSYDNWGGYNLLVKLNQRNQAVKDYIAEVIRFWVSEFDVDGIRLDAADVLDFDFMKMLRGVANEVKPDFWLMGEVIHGDYSRWVNEGTLHSVTNYQLHKALYSGHNDHNYFEIAHTVKYLYDMGGRRTEGLKLYNFVDNHDVERIFTKLNKKEHFIPVHILMYTLPGIPSIYYGSEFAIDGKKEKFSDDSLRPALNLEEYKDYVRNNRFTGLITKLGKVRKSVKALSYGDYNQLMLTNRQYAFSRNYEGTSVVVTVNNDDSDYVMTVPAGNCSEYVGMLSGQRVSVVNGNICVNVSANSGDIWVPYSEACNYDNKVENAVGDNRESDMTDSLVDCPDKNVKNCASDSKENIAENNVSESLENSTESCKVVNEELSEKNNMESSTETKKEAILENSCENEEANELYQKAFEEGRIAGLQEAIIARMERNGYVTDQMRNDVYNQTHIPSLINWVKSFN